MKKDRLMELAGVQVNEDYVNTVANDIPTDDIIEGLAIHCLENDLDLEYVIDQIKSAYNRSKAGREEAEKENG